MGVTTNSPEGSTTEGGSGVGVGAGVGVGRGVGAAGGATVGSAVGSAMGEMGRTGVAVGEVVGVGSADEQAANTNATNTIAAIPVVLILVIPRSTTAKMEVGCAARERRCSLLPSVLLESRHLESWRGSDGAEQRSS